MSFLRPISGIEVRISKYSTVLDTLDLEDKGVFYLYAWSRLCRPLLQHIIGYKWKITTIDCVYKGAWQMAWHLGIHQKLKSRFIEFFFFSA